jgi:aromatic ring-opening dioxygenase catalytic subunit (LigB family)
MAGFTEQLTPVHFFSHGSTMMLGEECPSADHWKTCGDEALANNIKGIITMGAHWDCLNDKIMVASNPSPGKSPVSYVDPAKYMDYKLNPDIPTAKRCVRMLSEQRFEVKEDPTFDWIHDTFLILIRMFPNGCPPTTIISMNARFDPHFHMKIGATLRPLRKEGYLIVGSGGAVHNLYRNKWAPMIKYRDNFAMETPPETWALEFRQAVSDVITNNSGPKLRRGMTRLMKHPHYREAHATDDHFMSAMFVSGAVGDEEDIGFHGKLMAEDWELVSTEPGYISTSTTDHVQTNMCNSQFSFGSWETDRRQAISST